MIHHSYLADDKRVVLRNGISDWIPVTSGVPQGSILGPLLFPVFVNDLPNIALSTAKLFADDAKLYRQIMNIMDCDILQDDLMNSLLGQKFG